MKDKIYDEYYNKIYYWSLKKLKNREDAQDLLNDIFVEIFTYINKNIKINNIDNLIWTIAYNTWKNKIRKIIKDKVLTDIENEIVKVEENNIDKIFYKDIVENLDDFNLTEKEKKCFDLYYKEDYSINEISKIINSTQSNIKYYLFNARKKIKERYDD